ncbi:MAG: hypothetical protein KAW41_03535 [Candidatus Diapherotrites archaeon]|nr:hypothetical protein [Candidatus Diapherotrites archaeon]
MCWTHVIIEAYCARKWSTKKGKYVYLMEDDGSFTKVKNTSYDPNYRTPRKPSYCKGIPNYICLEKNCPHLAYANAQPADYKFLNRKYKKKKAPRKPAACW